MFEQVCVRRPNESKKGTSQSIDVIVGSNHILFLGGKYADLRICLSNGSKRTESDPIVLVNNRHQRSYAKVQ